MNMSKQYNKTPLIVSYIIFIQKLFLCQLFSYFYCYLFIFYFFVSRVYRSGKTRQMYSLAITWWQNKVQ